MIKDRWTVFRSYRQIQFSVDELLNSELPFRDELEMKVKEDRLKWIELSHNSTDKFQMLIYSEESDGTLIFCKNFDSMDQFLLEWIRRAKNVLIFPVKLKVNIDDLFILFGKMRNLMFVLQFDDLVDKNLKEMTITVDHDEQSDILARVYSEFGFRKALFAKYLSVATFTGGSGNQHSVDLVRNEFSSNHEWELFELIVQDQLLRK
ncbi:Hypothetical protein J6896_04056 [Nakaseomyces glabratus]